MMTDDDEQNILDGIENDPDKLQFFNGFMAGYVSATDAERHNKLRIFLIGCTTGVAMAFVLMYFNVV